MAAEREPRKRVTTERKRRRPTRSGTVLTADAIVGKALELLDAQSAEGAEGDERLTVRKLGTALGADPSAVYRYFRNTDDLLLAVADRLIAEAQEGFAPGPDAEWAAALREFGMRVYRSAQRHPRVAALSTSRVTRRPHEYRAVDTGIGLLRAAGFGPEDAVRHYHVFIDTVLGHAALDAAVLRLPPEQRAADEHAWEGAYAELPAAEYPHLHVAREHLPVMAGSAFEPALDLLIEALAARAGAAPNGEAPGEGSDR